MILHLGVLDVPYSPPPGLAKTIRELRRQRRNDVRAAFGAPEVHATTGEVAEILEDKYRVMGNFFDAHENDIASIFEESVDDALENLLMGAPPGNNATAAATGDIETLFHKFISNREMETGEFVGGVPTKAALRGINHRLMHPYAKGNPQRPSFRDTGLYDASFRAWID